ncbi:MAG: PAS domain S-box protein [Variovorax sp.]
MSRVAEAADRTFIASLGSTRTAKFVASFDWSSTPLGAIDAWPEPLRTAVSMISRSPVAMLLLVGAEGIMIYNESCAVAVGDKHPGAIGSRLLSVWPDVGNFSAANIHHVLSGASASCLNEHFDITRGGKTESAWFDLDFSPVLDADGQPIAAFVVLVDTTARVLVAQRHEEERKRFVEMFERAPTFMAFLNGAEHRIELANPNFARLVGHRDVVGKTIAQAFRAQAVRDSISLLDEVYSSGAAATSAGQKHDVQVRRGGPVAERFIDFVYQPTRSDTGEVTGVFVQGLDVTDRVMAEAALLESDGRNRQIIDCATHFAIVAFDPQGKVTRWNEGAHRILGWTDQEMLGQDGACFFSPDDQSTRRLQVEMKAALVSGAGNDERWHVRKSGESFWASGEMMPMYGDDGQARGFVKVLRDRTEEHRISEALVQSERRLHRAQEAGGVGTFSVDVAAERVIGTREFYRILGLPDCDSVSAAEIEALVVSDDAALQSDAAWRGNEQAPLAVEYRIRRAEDGAMRWIARKAEFERDTDGTAKRLVGVVQDITERHLILQALEDSALHLRAFAEALPCHVWTARPDGLLDWFSERMYDYSGATPRQLDGMGWTDLLHPDDLDVAAAAWEASVGSGADYLAEFRIRRIDGMFRWHEVRALPLRSAGGRVTRWIGTNTDIHEHKLLRVDSTRDRDRLWMLSQELMLVCDYEGVITAINPAAMRLLGWAGDQMIGRTFTDFIHPDDLASTAAEFARSVQGISTPSFENRYRAHDQSYRLLSWTAVPDQGFVHAVARDVTQERTALEALKQAQKLESIGQLTGGVAHDFNNVLAVIKASTDLLRRVPLNDARRHRFIDSISNAVLRATKLTGQLLAFAQRQALQPVIFDAGKNTRAVSEMIGSLTGARIEIALNLAEQACFVLADPNQFDTALVNLAVNARDAMRHAGKLTIDVAASDGIPEQLLQPAVAGQFVAVSVSDTGGGIEPENLFKIFEPFFTTKGVGHGTGMGLSHVFGFAKQSGGDIRVHSTLGHGSRFTLYLPRAARPGQAADANDDHREALALGDGGCILVVEDNTELSHSVEQTLQEIGYTTIAVSSAEAALVELRANSGRFVAVFSDVVMGGMSGIELGREVRRLHGALPVVLSSGYSYVQALGNVHGFTLLRKPYALEDLARSLHEAIEEARGRYRPPIGNATTAAAAAAPTAATEEREIARQVALDSMQIMDSAEDAAYDELTRLASEFCQTPIALISLVDGERQWFKSRIGLRLREFPREHAFCALAIAQPEHLTIVGDASVDRRFAANPLVTGDTAIRFYAGAPLVTSDGYAVGALCVMDRVPRELDARQLEVLQFLASQVVARLEKRRADRAAGQNGSAAVPQASSSNRRH